MLLLLGVMILLMFVITLPISTENYKKMEKAYEKGKGCRVKLSESELVGCGLGKVIQEVKHDAQKVGKLAMKSGVADVAIDEAVNLIPMPSIAKKIASKAIKYEAHKLTGTGIKSNPYLPDVLSGGTLTPSHTQMSYISGNTQGAELKQPTNYNFNTRFSHISDGIVGKKYYLIL